MKFREFLIGFYVILCFHHAVYAQNFNWLIHFINDLKAKNNDYQVLLLFDPNEKYEDDKTKSVAREILRKYPMMQISFQDASYKKAEEWSTFPSFSSPRSTMIVLIHLSNDSEYMTQLNGPIDFVSNISKRKRRSKCLMVLPKEQKSFMYLKLLHHLWSKQFLDVTILELFEEKSDNYLLTEVHDLSKEIIFIHQWNPFRKSYSKFQFTQGVSWFPDKTKNLHNYQMKVGLFAYPPMIFYDRNEKDKVQNVSGPDIELIRCLSNMMNFKIEWISRKSELVWGVSKIPKHKSTGYMYQIMHNEIQFIAAERGRYATLSEQLHEWSKGTKFISQVFMIPILEDKSTNVIASWKVMSAFTIIGMLLIIWVLSHVMYFDRNNWGMLNIIQLLLGFSTTHEPRNLAERIFFGSILLCCMMNSSFIFTAITDVSLTLNSQMNLETIEDLVSSNLQIKITHSFYDILNENADEIIQTLLNKSAIIGEKEGCLDIILKEKHCSCMERLDMAKALIENNRDSSGDPIIKCIKEPLMSTVSGFVMEQRSPYVERFDKELLKMIQAGLVEKWQQTRYNHSSLVDLEETDFTRSPKTLLQKQITYILLFGYGFAIATFIFELLFVHV